MSIAIGRISEFGEKNTAEEIDKDLKRCGLEGLGSTGPTNVKMELSEIISRLIREELDRDPVGIGYASMTDTEKSEALGKTYYQKIGDSKGYGIVKAVDNTDGDGQSLTMVGLGLKPPSFLALGISLAGKRLRVSAGNNTGLILTCAAFTDFLLIHRVNLSVPLVAGDELIIEYAAPPRISTVLNGIPYAPNSILPTEIPLL